MAASIVGPQFLAPAGSTGNNTHNGLAINADADAVQFKFIVEVAGATPTVTFKVQGTNDDPSTSDANAAWTDIPYIPANTNTSAVTTQTVTAVGSTIFFLDIQSGARFFRRYRVVTSANTNITYRCEAYALDRD